MSAWNAAPAPRSPQPTRPILISSLPAACTSRDVAKSVANELPIAATEEDLKNVRRDSRATCLFSLFDSTMIFLDVLELGLQFSLRQFWLSH